jgi:Zn-dependent protease
MIKFLLQRTRRNSGVTEGNLLASEQRRLWRHVAAFAFSAARPGDSLASFLLKRTLLCTVMHSITNPAGDIDHPPEVTGPSEAASIKGFTDKFNAHQTDKAGTLSLNLGSFFGWQLRIHASFALQLVITWLIYFHQIAGLAGAIRSTSLLLIQFACILLHELGHFFAARGLGIKTSKTTLYCMGGVSRLSRIPTNKWHQIAIALAGPVVSMLIAIALFVAAGVAFNQNSPELDTRIPLLMSIASANMLLMMHNLAPAFPFDGGRILQTLLSIRLSHRRAVQVPAWIGQGFAIFFGLFAVVCSPDLFMNAFGIFFGARQQASIAKLDASTREMSRMPVVVSS